MKPTLSRVVVLLLTLLLATLSATAQSSGRIDRKKISRTLKGFVDKGELIGVSALVTVNGKEVYFGAFGLADREAKRPMARDTIVQIYSMTKPLTGTALMQLWEQGKFRMDDPVSKYIPELAGVKVLDGTNDSGEPILVAPDRPMTIRDLTRHTSGLTIGEDTQIPAIKKIVSAIDPRSITNTLDEFARRLGTVPLEFQPGTKWRYSFAVDVQALLVQRLSGQPFDVYLQEHVLKPLGMTHTSFYVAPDRLDKLAAMYNWTNGVFTRDPDTNAFKFNTAHWPLTPGSYGLTSTLDDYSRFARMLLNGGELDGVRILRPDTVRTMSTSQLDPAITDRSWLPEKGELGFGVDLAVRIDAPRKPGGAAGEVGEFFWDGLANTLFWVDPKNHLTAVLFTQYKPFGKVPLHSNFRAAIYSSLDPAAMPPK
ncbi:MAG TPA: serine hydrolase domain-containing protein [Candidatus Polarisedimenticolia bacterium]|nr:serine hydrolase domain-containing protein [Candidatus Polarisedimenticolia bacterium]